MDHGNWSQVTEFILGFPLLQGVQAYLFILLLLIDLTTILGNLLIILVVCLDSRLHTPTYHFVNALSLLELGYAAATVPKMLPNLLSEEKTISFSGCLLQIYFFHSLGAIECYLLTAVAYDRYLAVCRPLHYATLMTSELCVKIAVGCWLGGLAGPVTEISLASGLPFCGPNRIQHIFCDFPPVLSLACTDTSINVLVDFVINSCKILATFLLTLSSYVQIIRTVLRIPSVAGKKKAFSACASHLTVVLIFYGSILFTYVRPKKDSLDCDRALAVIYSVLTPFLNPFIYSFRNKDIKEAMRRQLTSSGIWDEGGEGRPSGKPMYGDSGCRQSLQMRTQALSAFLHGTQSWAKSCLVLSADTNTILCWSHTRS
ncbi:LOW QUALITY PROTEIN: olfactory receptor 6N1 [Eumetopias jubatus]|uniref:LOW QUALITY PROTEIN: olfactory receptor 6N1 n=1 Tax=Eumetopias jubatus TaxID=34886 RepID=UPI001016A376|nr:LOW QUALITY PROTEIN: olfactory receptor 6N1 [Eumetopias jubatus]